MSLIIDTFPFRDEFDLLECRLTELQDIPNLKHVLVEADRTHGGNKPKPYYYAENKERFAPWADRIVHVMATDMPSDENAWSREHAQREWCWQGLKALDAQPDDIVLHGDLDEIPDAFYARHVVPARGTVRFRQRLYCFAVDWLHPEPWWGTVAAYVKNIDSFAYLRSTRDGNLPEIPAAVDTDLSAGWHFSWLGGGEETRAKLNAFCHPEVRAILDQKYGSWETRLDECYAEGYHTDDKKLVPVDVDETYPKWIRDGNAPASWYRPRVADAVVL